MIDLSKFTFNKKILSEVVTLNLGYNQFCSYTLSFLKNETYFMVLFYFIYLKNTKYFLLIAYPTLFFFS